MEVNEIIKQLTDKFGDKVDVAKVTQMLGGFDHSKMSFSEIVAKLQKSGNFIGDLDGDGVQEGLIDEIKGAASKMFGGIFGK